MAPPSSPPPAMRRLALAAVPVVLVAVLAGCGSSARVAQQEAIARQQAALDSLRTLTTALRAENRTLADSLGFYDDIDSGQYYRDRRALMDRIERLNYELAVAGDGGLTLAVLPTDALFEPASATLHDAGRARLAELAAELEDAYPGRAYRIEGHSDSVPVGASLKDRYPSNWELSAARAAAVVRYLVEAHAIGEDRFEVVSYGASRPTATNATAAGRAANRRIRVAVLPAAETQASETP